MAVEAALLQPPQMGCCIRWRHQRIARLPGAGKKARSAIARKHGPQAQRRFAGDKQAMGRIWIATMTALVANRTREDEARHRWPDTRRTGKPLGEESMIELIPPLVYTADSMTRTDLSQGLIWDERFYVASLLSRARDLWRYAGGNSTFLALQPSSKQEQRFGIDALLLIRVQDRYKAVGLEAKRPGFGNAITWDKRLSKRNYSRFHRQLWHQRLLGAKGWVTGGLFLNELAHYQTGSLPGDDLGSTFVPRRPLWLQSLALMRTPPYHWKTPDLQALLSRKPSPSWNLQQLLEEVVACRYGWPMSRDALIATSDSFKDQLATSLDPYVPEEAVAIVEPDDLEMPDTPRDQQMSQEAELLRKLCLNTGASSAILLDAENGLSDETLSLWRRNSLDGLTRRQRLRRPAPEPSRL